MPALSYKLPLGDSSCAHGYPQARWIKMGDRIHAIETASLVRGVGVRKMGGY